jgi:methyltransferase
VVSGRASRLAFTALVAGVGVLRLRELRTSARNERALRARGGVEHAAGQMPWMRALHGAWFASMLGEVWLRDRPVRPALVAMGLAGLGAGVAPRAASMRALGDRWTATVMTVPGEPRVATGVFRWMRHPNYVGVAVEIAAVPLVHGAWGTAAVFSALDAAMLAVRIRAEERALAPPSAHPPGPSAP